MKKLNIVKTVAKILGVILALIDIGWTIYLFNIPNGVQNNAIFLLIIAVIAGILLSYGTPRD